MKKKVSAWSLIQTSECRCLKGQASQSTLIPPGATRATHSSFQIILQRNNAPFPPSPACGAPGGWGPSAHLTTLIRGPGSGPGWQPPRAAAPADRCSSCITSSTRCSALEGGTRGPPPIARQAIAKEFCGRPITYQCAGGAGLGWSSPPSQGGLEPKPVSVSSSDHLSVGVRHSFGFC